MLGPFENIQIEIQALPSLEDVSFKPVEKTYLTVRLISLFIFWAIILVGYYLLTVVAGSDIPNLIQQIIPYVLLVMIIVTFVIAFFGVKRKGYALRDRDIIYKKGLLWKSNTTVPFSRIQHCEVKQGPIARLFNLAVLHIYTAGGSSSDLSIPGLLPDTAQTMKSFVLQKIKSEEEV